MRIRAEGLSKRFGELEVLRDVRLTLENAEHVAILGPSGCGKTTLLRILLDLEEPTSGRVEGRLARAGYLPQDALLFPWKRLLDNVALPMQIAGVDRETRTQAVLDRLPRFGLAGFEKAYPQELSGGMRQRAALLRAVLTGADSLVLDEPFGALDTLTRHRLQDWLAALSTELPGTLLFVTHDLDEAIILARRVVLLSERPATVVGEVSVDLTVEARRDRLGRGFSGVRDEVMQRILERSPNDVRESL